MKINTNPVSTIIAFLPDIDSASAYALADVLDRPFSEIERRHITDVGVLLKHPVTADGGDEVFAIINRIGLKDGSPIKGFELHGILTRFSFTANIDHCDQLCKEIFNMITLNEINPARLRGIFISMRKYHTRNKALDKVRSLLSLSGVRI